MQLLKRQRESKNLHMKNLEQSNDRILVKFWEKNLWRFCLRSKNGKEVFCSAALTSTGWVRMTIKPWHCPLFLSSMAVIESQWHQIFLEKIWEHWESNLGRRGAKLEPSCALKECFLNPPSSTVPPTLIKGYSLWLPWLLNNCTRLFYLT